jgi:hypothetical protein
MTRGKALKHLRTMLFAVQKARSDLIEAVGDDDAGRAVNADLSPWLFGPKCILPALVKFLDRVESGGPIAGADFYNFMRIADRTPAILAITIIDGEPLPEPELAWCAQVWK